MMATLDLGLAYGLHYGNDTVFVTCSDGVYKTLTPGLPTYHRVLNFEEINLTNVVLPN